MQLGHPATHPGPLNTIYLLASVGDLLQPALSSSSRLMWNMAKNIIRKQHSRHPAISSSSHVVNLPEK